MKMPAFQFYPADWRKDPGVQALDFHDRGVWFEILCIMHESDERGVLLLNGRPMPEPALARMLGLDNQILTTTLTNLITYGVASRREADGALVSRRMVKDEALCQVRREAGKKGGNPNLVNQKPNQKPTTRDNQKPTPSSSSSTSISSNDDSAGESSSLPAAEPAPQPLEAKPAAQPELAAAADPAKAAALATTDPAEEQHWSVGPLTKPVPFKVICERLGHLGIDFEYYRRVALVAAEDKNDSRTILQWTSWIRNFFTNQLKSGPLLKPTDGEAARTGVHAPQFEGGYKHEVRADLQAERDRQRQESINLRIAANMAKHAAEGQQQQANPIGGAGRPPGA